MTDEIQPIIEKFELPYPNWYEPSTGRVYKDILIKNFNAIEEKINEITALNVQEIISNPDIENIEYPDVSFSDTDKDNQILNLRSFLNIVQLINYPLVVETNGSIKITKVEYWGEDLIYHTVQNSSSVTPTASEPYVYLNYNTNNIYISQESNTPENSVLIGVLINNKLYTKDSAFDVPTDVLSMICQQPSAKKLTTGSSGGNVYSKQDYNNQTIVSSNGESRAGKQTVNILRLGLD